MFLVLPSRICGPWVVVHNPRFFRRALCGGDTGMGEAFMQGDWSSPDLVAVVRLAVRNLERIEKGNPLCPR